MKKESASRSAFLNSRFLIGLFVLLTGVLTALAGAGVLTAPAANIAKTLGKYKIITSSTDPMVPVGFDCSTIQEKAIDKQENLRAGAMMIACGLAPGGSTLTTATSTLGPIGRIFQKLLAPLAYGAADADLITGTETSPNITQSETYTTANPDNPNQIVVAYNDSRGRFASPINMSGASVSSDGGLTFGRVTKNNGQSPFDNTMGDPVILYNKPTATWFSIWLDSACGSQGLGGYKSATPWDPSSWSHYCVHTNSQDDRESGWADNNPTSPFYGRMYVSWNDFNVGGGALFVAYSTDNGGTWSNARQITTGTPFIRDVQITGDQATGDVYVAGMNEGGGGFPHNDTNLIFRSTDGGNSWTNTYTGPSFPGPGVIAPGYFACMFSDGGGYWRHEGWGEPAAYNHVVHLVYAQHGTSSDPGDVYYIRSTDRGVTFSAPFKLNTDATARPQWQPNISVSNAGTLLATWYDARESTSCSSGNPGVPCYRMWSRKSTDNGVTWTIDDAFSDVVSPLPAQPDPGINATYAGDYDYGSAVITKHVASWVDGRVAVNNASQQDAFTDSEPVGFAIGTTDPACNGFINTQPVNFVINLTDPVNPSTVQATDLTVNGTPADSFALSNNNGTITFSFNTSPITQQGLQTMHILAGALLRASDGRPNLDFACAFNYAPVQLQVTATVPAVGGTFSPAAPQTYQYDVNWNIPVDPSSVQASDLSLSGVQGATVSSVAVINNAMTTSFMINVPSGGSLTTSLAPGAVTDAFGNPNAPFTGNYTVEGCQYIITNGTDPIVPGTTDTGNHCDDCDTPVSLPFPFQLYGHTYTTVNVNSNGRMDFVTANEPNGQNTACLPAPPNLGPYDYTIFPLWHDTRTEVGLSGCTTWANGCGIFTSVTGTAPHRVFNIEWHALRFFDGSPVNFEARLFENDLNQRFDIIYGPGTTISSADTAGVQGPTGSVTQDFCNSTPPQNASRSYAQPFCGTPSPTPTATATPTPCAPAPAPAAQSATSISFVSFTANWDSVSGATGYRLDVSLSSAFTTYVPGYQNLNVGNRIKFGVTGLSANTTYYYRVRAYNGCTTSPNSSTKSLKTMACTLKAPSIASAANVNFSSFSANWVGVSGAIDYRLDVSTSSSFTTYVPGYQDLHVGNVITYPVTGLNPSTTYYYRVRAYNGCSASPNSSSKSVLTLPCTPAAPSAGSASNVTFSSFRANWSSVSGAIDYRLDVSTSSSFISYVPGYQDLDVGNVTGYNVTGLNPSMTYYYRVRAYNGCATSANSSTKSVLTLACIPAAPSAQRASNVIATSFTANWRTVSGSTDYRLDVARDSSFTTYVSGYQNLSVGTVLSYSVTGLSPSTTYYYRVRSYNGCAASANSSVITVLTTQ